MNEDILRKVQIVCAWCGPAFVVFYGLSWCILGHNYPPPDSTYSAADLVNKFYLKYRGDILLGQSLSTCLGMLYLPWTCQLSAMMWKRDKSHILSLLQLTGGTTIETIAICLFAFLDKEEPAILPRWTAVLALFSGLSFLPLTFLPYFKTGIFAINGYWSFHVAFISYAMFTAIIGYYMAKSLKKGKNQAWNSSESQKRILQPIGAD